MATTKASVRCTTSTEKNSTPHHKKYSGVNAIAALLLVIGLFTSCGGESRCSRCAVGNTDTVSTIAADAAEGTTRSTTVLEGAPDATVHDELQGSNTFPTTRSKTSRLVEDDGVCHASRFLQAVIAIDNSASMPTSTSPRPTLADFDPLFEHVRRCGGAVAMMAITDHATPFTRLYVSPPPALRAAGAAVPDGLDFISQAQVQAVDEKNAADDAARLAAWRMSAEQRIAAFRRAIEPILAPPNWSTHTNIGAMLAMADAYYLELNTIPISARQQVLFIFSDGHDDINAKPLRFLKSRPTIYLINQIDAGDLAGFGVNRYGDVVTGLRYVLAEEQ